MGGGGWPPAAEAQRGEARAPGDDGGGLRSGSPNSGWEKKLRIRKPKTRFGGREIRVQENSVSPINVFVVQATVKVEFPSYDPSGWFPYALGVAPCPARMITPGT